MLASYNDMRTVPFWKSLEQSYQAKDHFKFYEPCEAPKAEDCKNDEPIRLFLKKHEQLKTTKTMVKEAVNELKELHDNPDIPDPYVALYKDWTDDPFGGGYHGWKSHCDVKLTMKFMRKPFQDQNVYIVGEAYSDQQGWVEGAFCVAERMLEEYFNLKRPDWIDPNYYLGW
jgi:hypothetical protein